MAMSDIRLVVVGDPASRPARERPNLLAKYYVTTEAVARSRGWARPASNAGAWFAFGGVAGAQARRSNADKDA